MIHNKATISKIETVLIEFGEGDILVSDLTGDTWGGIGLKNYEKREVGQIDNTYNGKTTDELKPEVVIMFRNQASIDVVIGKLLDAKNNLAKISNP